MERFTGIIGILILLGIAVLMSNNRRKINIRLVLWGLGLQLFFALFILKLPFGKPFFDFFDRLIQLLLSFSQAGSAFLFKNLATEEVHPSFFNFAFHILPTVIFFSGIMAILYYLKIMQFVIKIMARIMQKTMGTSGSETLSVAGNIFVGQTEAPLLIRPYIQGMTRSEIMTIMTGGFATVAGGVMAMYVGMLQHIEGIAGHLMTASVMSAPAAIVVAKIIYPETEPSQTAGELKMDVKSDAGNVMEALGNGATDGLKLAANIAAMLFVFVAVISLINYVLEATIQITMEEILGYVFSPLAWAMGVPWQDAPVMGTLLGEKIVLTELIAYKDLSELEIGKDITERTAVIATYALCGFANFASIGIQMGGIGGIAPNRKTDIAALAFKSMIGGAIASWLTATIAGILI